jgi:Holliday junction DNA helicase RuvA
MIGKLTGQVVEGGGELVVVEVGGVGYEVRVPLLALPLSGKVSLYIHTAVRDDAIDLYGFPTQEGLRFFKLLMSVSGIGPKTALSIMGVADPASLSRAIAAGDSVALTKVFGIGKKSAERMVVELRDKLADRAGGVALTQGEDGEVLEALLSLGYSGSQARGVVRGLPPGGSVKERLAQALRNLGARTAA